MRRFFTKLLLLALLLTNCRPTPTPELTPTPTISPTPTPTAALTKEIYLNLGAEPSSLDPALALEPAATQVGELLFLGLTDIDDETSEARPELATHWEVSEDGLTWTFHMRRDAHWVRYNPETGMVGKLRPVTAHDVEYGIKRTLTIEAEFNWAYVLFIIKNAEAVNIGKADPWAVGIKVLDDFTIKFTLEHPAIYFPAIAGMIMARPQPREAIEQHGEGWTELGNIVTNGPYIITSWKHGNRMVMERNPYYYDAEEVSIEKVNFSMVEDAFETLAMYERGELDVTEVPREEMERVKADPELSKELRIVPRTCTYYYGFTNNKPPFDNHLVRKAFSAAIGRRRLIEDVLKGNRITAHTFVPPAAFGNSAGDPDIAPWALDHELGKRKAKEWLAKAGYPDGQGFPEVILMHPVGEGHARIAKAIATMWEETLDVRVKIEAKEWDAYFETLRRDTPLERVPHIWARGYCFGSPPDAHGFLYEVFHSEQGANPIRWHNEEFDEVTSEAAAETNSVRRIELYRRAEKILCDEEAAVAPIFFYAQAILTKPWIERTYSPLGLMHIERWR